jgi:hypothetical protein
MFYLPKFLFKLHYNLHTIKSKLLRFNEFQKMYILIIHLSIKL